MAEYVPARLARGRVAIVGDAAHVPTPMAGSGFPESLCDAEAPRRRHRILRHPHHSTARLRERKASQHPEAGAIRTSL
ncbi:FAD-dependent monooxygenase [Arthrobacter sp. 9MFCol3.1]|uniref:FAD-dependent monooxygenase n=1 Tax=Arthrobacter sp. 9MFCol3.1 TaxID=1150398 RepID=UPI003FA474B7